jgi:chemotaxis protein CheC
MVQEIRKVDENFISKMRVIAGRGFTNSAKGLSKMIGQELSVTSPDVNMVPLADIAEILGGPENDAVGVYLRIEGNLSGQVMLIIPYQQALELCDMVMDSPAGTTQELGKMERSALSEIGNLTGAFFLNAIAELTNLSSHPSPPAVMVDMVGSILDVVVATMGAISDQVLMFKAAFQIGERKLQADFWIIPDPTTLEKLTVAEMKE